MTVTLRSSKGTSLTYNEMDANFEAIAPRTSATGAIQIPAGDAADRPDPEIGMLRWNTALGAFEGYNGSGWVAVIAGSAGNAFSTFAVSGQSDITATSVGDALGFVEGSNIVLTTDAALKQLTINVSDNPSFAGNEGLKLPVGTTGERNGTPAQGTIRYNTTDSSFEGYDGANWSGLGGTIDVDGDTKIIAETSPGTDNDQLDFYTAGSQRMRIDSDGTFRFGDTLAEFVINPTTGDTTIAGNLTIGDTDGDSLNIIADLSSNVVPDATDTYSLGADTKRWQNGYFSDNVFINDYSFPTADGTINQIMQTDGEGNVSFSAPDLFGGNRVYVSKNGNDNNDGVTAPVATLKRAAQIAAELVYTPVTPINAGAGDQADLLLSNKDFIAEEVIEYLNLTYPSLTYDETKCRRDTVEIVESVAYDLRFGGNARSVLAGERYYAGTTGDLLIPSDQRTETVAGIDYARDLAADIITNTTIATVRGSLTQTTNADAVITAANSTTVADRFNTISSIVEFGLGSSPTIVYSTNIQINNVTIMMATGDYVEQNPIILADNVSVVGDNLRRVIIRPDNANQDIIRVRNSSYVTGVTFRDKLSGATPDSTWRYAISFDNIADTDTGRTGYVNLPASRAKIFTSPYIQNCSVISFLGGNGVEIDGNLIDTPNTPPTNIEAENPVVLSDGIPEQGKSMVANAFTILSFGGNAWRVMNDAYAQIVSCFVIFTENGCLTQNGGYLSITNSATNFGLFALRSTGYSPNAFAFDRGIIYGNGISESFQTLKVAGLQRPPLEHFVLRFYNQGTDTDATDTFNNNGTFGYTASIDPTVSNITGREITFSSAHSFVNGDIVEYDANGNLEIVGLLNECEYYVSVVDADTITLFNDEALTKQVRELDATLTSGTHYFKRGYEEFYINEVISTHDTYQEVVLPAGTYTITKGDTIAAVDGTDVISAVIVDWDSGTYTLTVSVELVQVGDSQVRNTFTSSSVINAGEINASSVNVSSVTDIDATLYSAEFTIQSTQNRSLQAIASTTGYDLRLNRPSICNSSAHTWEYAGSGTDYNALPQNGGQTDEYFEQVSTLPGRVYTSGTNELGDFKVGTFVKAFNRTGNIEFVNQVSIGELDTLALSLSSGVVVNEISADIELGDNEVGGAKHTRLTTQLAQRSFLNNRLGNFIDQNLSTNSIPNSVVQLNSQGQINSDLIPAQSNFTSFSVDSYEGRFDLHNDIPVNDLKAGDIVIETYNQTSLTLSGTVSLTAGETITQLNTGANGIVKTDISGSNSINLIEPLNGTFSINAADTLSGSTSGALGVYPTIVTGPEEVKDNYFITTSRSSQYLITDPNGSYDFTNIISGNTQLQGATSGAVCTVDSFNEGVLIAVDVVSLPGGNGYTTAGTYTDVALTNISGSGTGAIADVTVSASGQITGFDLKRGGTGYTSSDVVSVSDADVGGRSGGSAINIDVTEVEDRLYITLNQDAGREFASTSTNLDFIIDDNVTSNTIADVTGTSVQTFDARDVGAGGDVNYVANTITITGHGYTNGDPVVYDSGTNVVMGNTTNLKTYYLKVIDANTIEFYEEYGLDPAGQVNFSTASTGNHSLTIQNVNTSENRIYFAGHGYQAGDALKIIATTPPTGLEDGDYVFVGSTTTNSFTLHQGRGSALDSVSGLVVSAIDLTATGSGSLELQFQNVIIVGDANTSGKDAENWSSLSNVTIDADNIVSGIIDTSRLGIGQANSKTFLAGDSSFKEVVQGITTSAQGILNNPITLNSGSDVSGSEHFNVVDISLELATLASAGTETLGIASYDFNHFVIDSNGKITTKPSTSGGVIDAATVGGLSNTQFLRSDASDTATGIISITNTTQSTGSANGALVVTGGAGIGKNLYVGGNLVVNGTTTTVNSSTVTIDDPVFTLGGDTAPATNDGKDRGIEFRWHDGSDPKLGFFGFDRSDYRFKFIQDATNSSEVFTGDPANVLFANGEFEGIVGDTIIYKELWSAGSNTAAGQDLGTWTFTGGTFRTAGTAYYDVDVANLPGDSNYMIWVGAGTLTSPIIDLRDYIPRRSTTTYVQSSDESVNDSKVFLTAFCATQSMDSSTEYMVVEITSDAKEGWTERARLIQDRDSVQATDDTTWHKITIDITDWADFGFQVRFRSTGAGTGDGAGVANMYIHQATMPAILDLRQLRTFQDATIDGSLITNTITSRSTNTNLAISANGTGVVEVNDTLQVDGTVNITTNGLNVDSISSYSANTNLNLSADGTGVVEIDDTLQVDGTTNITTGGLNVDSISSYTNNTNLTLSADGTGIVEINDNAQINGTLFFNTTASAAISFEGTNDNFESSLSFTDPTADRVITIPDADGVVVLDQDVARSLGAVPAYGSAVEDNVQWDATQQAIKLYSSTDDSIGLVFPAFEVNALGTQSLTPIRGTIAIKGDVASTTGLYIRIQELDADLTVGKTHVSNNASTSSPLVHEDTRQIALTPIGGGLLENQAVPTNWTTYTFNYTPTSTAKWASVLVLNWTGHGTNAIWVQPPQINQDIGDTPFFEEIKLKSPVSASGYNQILRAGDNAFNGNMIFTLPETGSGKLIADDNNGRVVITNDAYNSPSIRLHNTAPDTFPPRDGAEFIISRQDINGGGGNIGRLKFRTTNENDVFDDYVVLKADQVDHTAGTEDGELKIQVMMAGSLTTMVSINDFEQQSVTLEPGVSLRMRGNSALSQSITLYPSSVTANRTITIPDATGTMALTSDIPDSDDSPTFENLTLATTTSNQPLLRIANGSSDTLGPVIEMGKTTTLEGNGDDLGTIRFFGNNNSNVSRTYAEIFAECTDVAAASEDGYLRFRTLTNGVTTAHMYVGYEGQSAVFNGRLKINTNGTDNGILVPLTNDSSNKTVLRVNAGASVGGLNTPIIRVDNSNGTASNDRSAFGFTLRYRGDLSGNSNRLELSADDQQAVNQLVSWYVLQDGIMYFQQGIRNAATSGTTNIGASAGRFNTVYATVFDGTATEALYADVAEKYLCDEKYETGTVLSVGGEKELTASSVDNAHSVLGVVSDNPALLMNTGLEDGIAVALKGRVPVKITGSVKQGDRLAPSSIKGRAEANNDRMAWSFAIALHDSDGDIVEAVIL